MIVVLVNDYNISCEDPTAYMPFTFIALIFIGVWVIGIPLLILLLLRANLKHLHVHPDMTMAEIERHEECVAEFGTLYLQYERKYWWFEIVSIFKKMLLTGPMVIIASGSSVQIVIALMVVLIFMLMMLKLAPFEDDADDWLSFLTSFQMLVTLIAGLLIKTDNPTNPTYDSETTGIIIIAVNSMGMIALFLSILTLHPAIRRRINTLDISDPQKEYMQTEINKDLASHRGEEVPAKKLKKKEPDEHDVLMASAMKLYRSGKISARTAKKVIVVQEMCQDGTIEVLEVISLLRKWHLTGLFSDKELPHILAIYGVVDDVVDDVVDNATSLKGNSSSTKVVPVSSDGTTGVDLPAIRKKVST